MYFTDIRRDVIYNMYKDTAINLYLIFAYEKILNINYLLFAGIPIKNSISIKAGEYKINISNHISVFYSIIYT